MGKHTGNGKAARKARSSWSCGNQKLETGSQTTWLEGKGYMIVSTLLK